MAVRQNAVPEAENRILVIERIVDAPRALVFKAWTEPQHLVRWWGPRGFTTPVCEMDARPGGTYRFGMRSPEGRNVWWRGVCRELIDPERIVWTCILDDADGNRISAETTLTVTLEEHEGKTRLTLHQAIFDSVANRDSHNNGWNDALGRLAEYLATI